MKKTKLKGITVHWSDCKWAPCVLRYEAVFPGFPAPIGIVWVKRIGVRPKKKIIVQCHVLYSWTHPIYRRRGVRTAIQKSLFEGCDQILTGGAASREAKKFMEKQGYTLSQESNWWLLNKKK